MRELQNHADKEYRKGPEEAMRLYDERTVDEVYPHLLKSQRETQGRDALVTAWGGTPAATVAGAWT